MKKLSLALAVLGLGSTAVYAGGIDYQEPNDLGVFKFGVEGLYVQPLDGNAVYGVQSVAGSNVNKFLSNNTDFQWGYHLDIAYAMPGNGVDISLGYTDLNTDDSETRQNVVQPVSSSTATVKTSYDYNDVDLLIGKEFVLENRYHFHPFVGLRYAEIASKDYAVYTTSSSSTDAQIRNKTEGLGPRAGLDAAVEFSNGFSLVGRAAGSLLYSNLEWRYSANGVAGDNPSVNLKNSGQTIVVPEVDYRLGVNYSHEVSPETSLGFEIGWTGVQYLGAIDKNAASSDAFDASARPLSDWGFQGPYLRVQANIA